MRAHNCMKCHTHRFRMADQMGGVGTNLFVDGAVLSNVVKLDKIVHVATGLGW